jgi:hypothetical protein
VHNRFSLRFVNPSLVAPLDPVWILEDDEIGGSGNQTPEMRGEV